MSYQPIENHGIIGNMRTAALVSLDGSIDWLCLPRFDSPSVFGAILDSQKGGLFRIAPAAVGELRHKQYYWPETNVLVTRFLHPDGIAEVEDYMPVGVDAGSGAQLVRRVRVVRGRLSLEMQCLPAFDYARATHTTYVERARCPFSTGPVYHWDWPRLSRSAERMQALLPRSRLMKAKTPRSFCGSSRRTHTTAAAWGPKRPRICSAPRSPTGNDGRPVVQYRGRWRGSSCVRPWR